MSSATALLKIMLEFAAVNSGLSAPANGALPPVEFASDCAINRTATGLFDVPCLAVGDAAIAVYDDTRNVIMLPLECRGFRTAQCRMLAVHEIVHWLQDRHGIIDASRVDGCINDVEPLAYKVGNEWARQFGGSVTSAMDIMINSMCPTPY